MAFEWDAFEAELTVAAADAVRAMVEAAGSQTPYAVAFSEFYAETTGVIYLPNLALATEESVEDPDCRFSPPDWPYQDYEWGDTDARWGERLGTGGHGSAPRGVGAGVGPVRTGDAEHRRAHAHRARR